MGEDRQKCCPFQGLFPAPLLSWDPVVLEEKGCSPGMSPPSREELGEGSELSGDIFQPDISGTSWI